jgi:hypothetical protein
MRAANHSDIITPFPVALTTPHKGQNLKSALLTHTYLPFSSQKGECQQIEEMLQLLIL